MSRAAALLAAAAAILAGCPLPQPVPSIEGDVVIAPPRIVSETARPAETVVTAGIGCPEGSRLAFDAALEDPDVEETVEVRWFVDYDASDASTWGVQKTESAQPAEDGVTTRREITDFLYELDRSDTSQAHVIELVVSNGFWPLGTPGLALPNRSPQQGFETQVFRWLVLHAEGGRCE